VSTLPASLHNYASIITTNPERSMGNLIFIVCAISVRYPMHSFICISGNELPGYLRREPWLRRGDHCSRVMLLAQARCVTPVYPRVSV